EVAADFGYQFGPYAEGRLGLGYGYANLDVTTGELELADDHIRTVGWTTRWSLDRLDSVDVPRDGVFGRLSVFGALDALGSEDEFTRVEFGLGDWERRGGSVFFATLQGGLSPGGDLPIYAQFTVGGLLSLSGFSDRELLGQDYGVLRAGYYRQILGSKFYAGGWLEAGEVWDTADGFDTDELIYTGTLAMLWDSQLGPVILAYGRADVGDDKVYLAIGRTF
ncbi:MAG TPA: BamA/TamA family outer membrane protein, partial [Solirubrobacterales bacterium]|nr:BamA/TamA family outer membrane protein [Solirubrobacterales bacterium]